MKRNGNLTFAEVGALTLLLYADLIVALVQLGLTELAIEDLGRIVDDLGY